MTNHLNDLKETISDLITDLSENVFDSDIEKGELMVVQFFFNALTPEKLMKHVVRHILPHKERIDERNVDFFLTNEGLFASLPEDRVNHYSKAISNGERVTEEDRRVIWEYFDTIIAIAGKYESSLERTVS